MSKTFKTPPPEMKAKSLDEQVMILMMLAHRLQQRVDDLEARMEKWEERVKNIHDVLAGLAKPL